MRVSAKRGIRNRAALRHALLTACGLILSASPGFAAEPTGEWLVESKAARIKIEDCGGALWGVLSWEVKPGRDTQNPDPALRGRPTLGIPILLNLKPAGGAEPRWEGQVYNATNGKTYSANVKLVNPNVLKIEGCLFTGFLCGGEEWTRVSPAASANAQAQGAPKGAPKTSPRGGGAPTDVCSRVSNLAGRSH